MMCCILLLFYMLLKHFVISCNRHSICEAAKHCLSFFPSLKTFRWSLTWSAYFLLGTEVCFLLAPVSPLKGKHCYYLFPLPSWFELPEHTEIVERETNSAVVLTFHLVYQSCFQVKFLTPDFSVGRSQPCGLIILFVLILSGFIQPLTRWEIIPPFYSSLSTFFLAV